MKIENPLMTGNDLESIKFQVTMLRGMGTQLATEDLKTVAEKASSLFSAVALNVRDFSSKTISMVPKLSSYIYKPAMANVNRIQKLNYGVIRSYIITSIPDTDAKVHDFLGYLDMLSDIVNNTIRLTIPGCKEYFSLLLEDTTILSSASAASAIDRLSTNKFAMETLNKKYPGIIKRNDHLLAKASMAKQYDNIKDFVDCQSYLKEITERSSAIRVDLASKDVNQLNELISRVIMVVKRKGDIDLEPGVVTAVSEYLYNLADEIAMISVFATYLDITTTVLTNQINEIVDQAGV